MEREGRGNYPMKKILEHLVPFPIDAESDSFIAALASALVITRGYTAETPYWCAAKGRFCVHCSPCGDSLLERHQTSVYHCLLTTSTLAFGFDYPWDDTVEPHSLPGFPNGWRWDRDFVDALARFGGFSYTRFDGAGPEERALSSIKSALDAGFPTLLRPEGQLKWTLAVGYDGDRLWGLDSRLHPLPEGWLSALEDAIVITGRTASGMSYRELLERIVRALSYEEHGALEGVIEDMLSHVTPENALETAGALCAINGVPIEARWHAAEAFTGGEKLLWELRPEREIHERLASVLFSRYIQEGQGETHGVGWEIWGALGVGPETGYAVTPRSAELILRRETQERLKCLFGKIFENDRAVCAEIRACLEP